MTLLLNEAYATLMDESLRGTYNEAHSHKAAMRAAGHTTFTGSPFSQWVGPDRPQGLFVDETVCIGKKLLLCFIFGAEKRNFVSSLSRSCLPETSICFFLNTYRSKN